MDFQPTAEQRELNDALTTLARKEFAETAFTHKGAIPHDNLRRLAELGFLGMCMDESVGGGGRPWQDGILATEALARICPTTAYFFFSANTGPSSFIAQFGNDSIKERFLPGVMSGEEIIRIAISEPEAGSDVTAMRTSADIRSDEVVINGNKIFSSHADKANAFIVYVRFGPTNDDIGAVVVERDAPGLTIGPPDQYMSGTNHCELLFENCTVPVDNVLIREQAFRKLMGQYSIERTGRAAHAVGISQLAIDMSIEHLKTRKQFGSRLADFQGLQWMLADMAIQLDAARLLLYRAMTETKDGFPTRYNSSVAKVHCAETATFVTDHAMQLHGGMGFTTSMPLEYLYRQVRAVKIAGGTVQVHRNGIAKVLLRD
jgi:alkylation response protein AidB-like acyl-CoA dehydrogenase